MTSSSTIRHAGWSLSPVSLAIAFAAQCGSNTRQARYGFGRRLRSAAAALIEELAGIGRHGFDFRNAAVWTSDERFKNHCAS
jgi:hypothetical protein